MPTSTVSALESAASLIRNARYAVAFTGAGISTPSGIPDFRSPGSGLWTQTNPLEAASLTTFRRNPEKFYAWLHPLAVRIAAAQPNPAHKALARLEEAGCLQAVITQNIDQLHQQAGSRSVIQLHGSMEQFICPGCKKLFPGDSFHASFIENQITPACPDCHAVLKPGITLFEEGLPVTAWEQACTHARQADLMIIVGTSLEVFPASMIPRMALEAGAQLIINNRTITNLDPMAAFTFKEDAAILLPKLLNCALI